MPTGFLSPWHIAIFLIVVLLLFGPKRLPEAGRALGKGLREFKDSIAGRDEERTSAPAAQAELPAARDSSDPAG